MSKKYLQIQIPTPCSEDFSKMTSVEKGHYCSSCEKVVIDFSKMSDREIVDFYKKNKGKFCGQFHKSQLNRSIRMTPPKVNSFFGKAAGLLLTGVLSAGATHLAAQNLDFGITNAAIELESTSSEVEKEEEKNKTFNEKVLRMKIISNGLGYLGYSETKQAVQGVGVKLQNSDLVAISDTSGIVEFNLSEELLRKKKLVFNLSHFFHKDEKVKIRTKKINKLTFIQVPLKFEFPNSLVRGAIYPKEINYPIQSAPHEDFCDLDGKVNHFKFEEEYVESSEEVQKNKSLPNEEEESIFPPLGVAIKKVYPNPFIDEINLEISTAQEGNIKIQLVDISGQVVFQKEEFVDRGTQEYTLYVGNLSLAGNLFILQVQDESGQMQSLQMMRFTNQGFTFR